MDAYERMKQLVDHITYKPGWDITVTKTRDPYSYECKYDISMVLLTVKFETDDAIREGKKVTLQNQKCFFGRYAANHEGRRCYQTLYFLLTYGYRKTRARRMA